MTPKQRINFYFPAWCRCAIANSWQMKEGCLLAALDEQHQLFATWPDPAGPLAIEVLDTAATLAEQDHSAITAEHLRHACNHVATNGRTASAKQMTNQETNRVVDLFNLLSDPWNLTCVGAWLNPTLAEKNSYLAFLRKQAPEDILVRIARNAFDTQHYADLDLGKLRWIATQVKSGRPAPKTALRPPTRETRNRAPETTSAPY
jgi:hypothetical protein